MTAVLPDRLWTGSTALKLNLNTLSRCVLGLFLAWLLLILHTRYV